MKTVMLAVLLGLYIVSVTNPAVGSYQTQERQLDFLAKPVAFLAIYPPKDSEKEKPTYYWLFEATDLKSTGDIIYWATEYGPSKLDGELQGSGSKNGKGQFSAGALKFVLDFQIQTEGAAKTRRFYAPLESSKTFRIVATLSSGNKLSFGIPAPEKYKGRDIVEVDKEDKIAEIPLLMGAAISEAKQK